MTSKPITKIKNRPNYYYFDTAINDSKKTTVKYCLFTEYLYEAKLLALKIKNAVNLTAQDYVNKNKVIIYN